MCSRRGPAGKWRASARSWSSDTTVIPRGTKRDTAAAISRTNWIRLEGIIPGIGSYGLDVIGNDGSHPKKAGPCAKCNGAEQFLSLANEARYLPHRLPAIQRPRRRGDFEAHDSGGAGLPCMSTVSHRTRHAAIEPPEDRARQTIERQQMDGRHRLRGLWSRDGRLPDHVEPQLAESRWLGAAGECNVARHAAAGDLLRTRRRAGLRSFGRGHAGAWNTRQFPRRGPYRRFPCRRR